MAEPQTTQIKKYRAFVYDIYDEKYAKRLSDMFTDEYYHSLIILRII